MLEPYRELLTALRQDEGRWSELACAEVPGPDGYPVDAHERRRYGVLLVLQYHRRAEDPPLLRYLLEQEVLAHRNAPFQGFAPSLESAAFLVASLRSPEDLWLLAQAKLANFDTYCGLDTLYLFTAGVKETLSEIDRRAAQQPDELAKGVQALCEDALPLEDATIRRWWAEKQTAFPANEADEDPLRLVERAHALEAVEEGRRWLDAWEATAVPGADRLHTLLVWRRLLGQPREAVQAARELVSQAGPGPWEQASTLQDLGEALIQAGEFREALFTLEAAAGRAKQTPDWTQAGLSRAILEGFLDLGLAAPPGDPVRREALDRTHALVEEGVGAALTQLRKAVELAGTLRDLDLERRYTHLAEAEARRIQTELDGLSPADR